MSADRTSSHDRDLADNDLEDALLAAQVAFHVRQLRGEGFESLVRADVRWALDRARGITLDAAVSREQVKAVARKYVASFRLPGSIPEVAGELVTRLREDEANQATLGEIVDRRHVEAFAGKVAELRAARERVAAHLVDNATLQAWLADFVVSLASSSISANRAMVERLPGVASVLSLGDRVVGGAVREADQRAREFAERAAAGLLRRWQGRLADSLTDEEFAAALLEIWDGVADRRVRDLVETVDGDDLEDLVAIGYETWLDVRGGAYLHALVDAGVDYFFDLYGALDLAALLEEFGLGSDDLVEEALRFAPRVIALLDDAGLLAELLRRRLADFYASPEARALLRP